MMPPLTLGLRCVPASSSWLSAPPATGTKKMSGPPRLLERSESNTMLTPSVSGFCSCELVSETTAAALHEPAKLDFTMPQLVNEVLQRSQTTRSPAGDT